MRGEVSLWGDLLRPLWKIRKLSLFFIFYFSKNSYILPPLLPQKNYFHNKLYFSPSENFSLALLLQTPNLSLIQMERGVSSWEHQTTWALPCFTTWPEAWTEGFIFNKAKLAYALLFFIYWNLTSLSPFSAFRFWMLDVELGDH